MAAPAEGGAGGEAGAAAAAAEALTFNDASSFDKLTDYTIVQFPSKASLDLYTIEDDQFGSENPDTPSPKFLREFKRALVSEVPGLHMKDIDYDPARKTLYTNKVSFPICILPEGSIIHRFDKEGAKDPSKNVPIFFGNLKGVSFYSGKKSDAEINTTRSSYRIKRPVRLLHINAESIGKIQQLDITPEEMEFIRVYFRMGYVANSAGKNVETPLIVPAMPYGTIAEIRSQTFEKTFNRRFAEIVCRLGFDGWVIKGLNPDKEEGVIQITGGTPQLQSPDGKVVTIDKIGTLSPEQGAEARFIAPLRGNLSPMLPEIVICRWDVFMDRIKGGGSRRRRHKSRGTRHLSRRRRQ